MSDIVTIQLDCGAVLVVEPIPSVASVALSWRLPLGSATDPPEGDGMAAMLSELIFRGAAGLDSREHSDALDLVGVQRSSGVSTHHLRLSATLLGDRIDEALPLLTAMVREPTLPAEALRAVRSLCVQTLDSLSDDPQHLVMLRLRQRHLAPPFNRHGYGCREVFEHCSIEALREAWVDRCRPGGTIVSAAGAVDPEALARRLNELLEGWSGEHRSPVELGPPRRGRVHASQDTAQMHIGLAYDAPREADARSRLERVAVGVLSGGTSARLFTEVRQKRSLCYSVGASFNAGRDYGLVALYAGTTPERAHETLDVCTAEIERLREGVSAEELERAVVGLKSQLVMQGESTAARAAAIGQDQFCLGRARSLAEIARQIASVTVDELNAYLRTREFGEFTVASIGPAEPAVGAVAEPGRGPAT
ncbi:MAG: M16 family metallopeptidase [Planctomycetota bacterium]